MMRPDKVVGEFLDRVDVMVTSRRFDGQLSEKITLLLIGLLPFLPRPTLEHPVRFAVPAFILLFLVVSTRRVLHSIAQVPGDTKLRELILIGGALFTGYVVWSLVGGHVGELSRIAARGFWIATYLCMITWFFATGISICRVYKCVFLSTVLLSVLVLFVGITGATIFEAPRAGRTYGIEIPFFKNTGIPRSYGEFGILMSIAWAYWLVYFGNMKPITRNVTGLFLVMATFISQSRSTYLSVLIITIVFAVQAFIRNRHTSIRKWTFTGIMIGAILLPLLLEVVLASPFGRIGVIEAVVGTDTFEENVLTRFLVIGSALEVLLDGGTSAIFGISHTAWDARFEQLGQLPVALHNHFLSNLVFYGFLGGTVSLVTFFAWPFFGVLTRQLRYGDKTSLVALLALFGGIVNLHFYEGFFSLILALELALLWCISRGLMLETRAMKLAS